MRICHVITRLIVGGAQENTLITCRGLQARGHQVFLVSGPETGSEGDLLQAGREAADEFLILSSLHRAPHPLRDLQALLGLWARFRQWRPDVVHTHSSKAGILGRIAARLAGVRTVIHTNHGLPFHEHQPRIANWLWRLLEKGCGFITDRLICVSKSACDESKRARLAPAWKHEVIRSGMDVDAFVNAKGGGRIRKRFGIPGDAPVLGWVGRFADQKGPRDFLDVARRVDAHVLWVGDGPLRAGIEAEVRDPRIKFAGLVPPEEIPTYLEAMDVVAHTSFWEGLPRVAVQASLVGRPVVAYDTTGISEVIRSNGYIVRPHDAAGMASRASEILRSPDRGRAMGASRRDELAKMFSRNAMVDAIEAIYLRRSP